MIENLLPLKIPPGIFGNGTKYQAAGRWREGNLVRFHEGTIQPIGGWVRRALTGATLTGTVHAAISWLLGDGTPVCAVGTENGLYIIDSSNVVYDVTPTVAGGNAAPYNWQLSTFGTYLVAINSLLGGDDLSAANTFVWTGNTAVHATTAYGLAVGPAGIYSAFATPERFLTLLRGKDPTGGPAPVGITPLYSERRVYWSSQETINDYISTDINTGGSFDLTTQGRLICGAASRGQSLLWTDVDLWTMNYIGGELIYSFNKAGDHCGIVSKRAVVLLDKGAFWMGRGKFFAFDGFVKTIPCEVTDAVFDDFNDAYAHTVWAVANPKFNEVTWFYPALGSARANRYVTYNYEENHWTLGQLIRSAGVQARFRFDVINAPLPVFFDGVNMYEHESGQEREAQAYLASGPIELGNGDRLMRIQGVLPDDRNAGDVQLRLYTSNSPDAAESLFGPYSLGTYTPVRLTARQCRVKLEETGAVDWRVGNVRLAVIPVERRGPGTSEPVDNVPASLEIIPAEVTLTGTQHYTFTSIVRNAAGQVLDITPDAWTSDNAAAVSVDTTGTVTALEAPSVAHIQAFITTPALSSNLATVNVASRVPASLVIQSTMAMEQTDVVQTTYTVRDAFGVILTDIVPNVWTSSTPATATVDSIGRVTAVASSGTTNIQASITVGVTTPVVSNLCAVTVLTHWIIHTFNLNDNFVVSSGSGNVEALIVAGGGSGGSVDGTGAAAGGGGAGGLIHLASFFVTPSSYPVVRGAGGVAPHADHTIGSGSFGDITGVSGNSSSFGGYTAVGGGGGGGSDGVLERRGRVGGSGGGGASAGDINPNPGAYSGGAGTAGQGSNGGDGANSSFGSGSGGGGAGGAGSLGTGGAGLAYDIASINSTMLTYAAGGGAVNGGPGVAGTAGRGNGGSGGGQAFASDGGNGGAGVVIIKYRVNTGIVATGGTRVALP